MTNPAHTSEASHMTFRDYFRSPNKEKLQRNQNILLGYFSKDVSNFLLTIGIKPKEFKLASVVAKGIVETYGQNKKLLTQRNCQLEDTERTCFRKKISSVKTM